MFSKTYTTNKNHKHLGHITYFNYSKESYYTNTHTKLKKDFDTLEN